MPARCTFLLALALTIHNTAALSVTTLSVPGVQVTDAPHFVWSAIGTGADGRTTYAVLGGPEPGLSDSDYGSFTATVALGATDAVVYESESQMGAVTESCAWGAGSRTATCVIVGPSISGSVTVTGTETFTANVGEIPVTLAVDPPASTSGVSSSRPTAGSSVSRLESPTDTAGVTGGPAPTPNTNGGAQMVVSSAAALGAAAISFLWTL